jgi:hypothetical protein
MRAAALILLVLLAAACKREPSFDERYAKVAHDLRSKSLAIDAELASEAAEASALASLSPPPTPTSSPAAR